MACLAGCRPVLIDPPIVARLLPVVQSRFRDDLRSSVQAGGCDPRLGTHMKHGKALLLAQSSTYPMAA